MVIFYKKWKKYNEIQLTKNKMDWKDRKRKIIHPPLLKYSNGIFKSSSMWEIKYLQINGLLCNNVVAHGLQYVLECLLTCSDNTCCDILTPHLRA